MFRTRSVVAICSTALVVLAFAGLGRDVGWLFLGLPSCALLPVFAVAALTKAYERAVTAVLAIQIMSIVVSAVVVICAWPFAIPQVISTVLGFVALRDKDGDEARIAGSVSAMCVIPGIMTLSIDPTAFVFVATLGVAGYLWYRDARRRARNHGVDPRDNSDLELPRAVARAA